ncbi:hemagglutinin repeat-containing protein [Cupriavidus basilensis]|uniref:Hemolysin n=1 Tax=Cupriavidus basilensis TaxID=68895 RepID=A0A0C4YN48_9BURK|nr:hemagglutinin repeat-containing protein [Cupriavidus basilensis]AJG23945.1 Hemolysin [Cupriavidus basilensis]
MKESTVDVSHGIDNGNAGVGVSASASKAKGNSDSRGVSQTNSHVSGRESVTLLSGNDTNILGATLSGGKVIADVGGNLNIASRQDTEETRARQESISGGFSISQGGGSASFSASNGSYANVSEQAGIHAERATLTRPRKHTPPAGASHLPATPPPQPQPIQNLAKFSAESID